MKKLAAVLICLLAFAGLLLTASAEATAEPAFAVDAVTALAGTEVDVAIRVVNNPGIASIKLSVVYDPTLVLNKITYNNAIGGQSQQPQTMASPVTLNWFNGAANSTGDWTFVVLHFSVPENTAFGSYPITISYEADNVYNIEEVNLNFAIQNGSVTVGEQTSTISSAQISLGTDITVNYFAALAPSHLNAQMRFTMNGRTETVSGVKNGEEYVFAFTGVSPQCMGDNIKAELIFGDTVLDTVEHYSVRQNCLNLLSKSADELGISSEKYAAMKTLIADLLEYGAKAQLYKGYKTDALVNDGISGQSAFVSLLADCEKELEDGSARADTAFTAAGVYFDYHNKLYFKFTAPDITETNFYVQVTDGDGNVTKYYLSDFELLDAETSTYILYTDAISATEFDSYYEVKLCDASNSKRVKTVQTLYYSIASYVYAKQNSGNAVMAELAKATYNYGLSAVAFANAK